MTPSLPDAKRRTAEHRHIVDLIDTTSRKVHVVGIKRRQLPEQARLGRSIPNLYVSMNPALSRCR